MRTFKICRPRALPFRLLLIAAGALLLMAALAPRANAQSLIAYYNFEDGVRGGPPDYTAEPIAFVQASMVPGGARPYAFPAAREAPGLTQNVWPTDPDLPRFGLGLSRTSDHNNAAFDIPLFSSQGLFQNMTISFAISGLQNDGFNSMNIRWSTDGGATFATFATHTILPGSQVFSDAVPSIVNNQPNLVLELEFNGGQSNGNQVQNVIDNVTVSGEIVVPEPTTVAGGLLGVLGLCWFQRRRIDSLRALATGLTRPFCSGRRVACGI